MRSKNFKAYQPRFWTYLRAIRRRLFSTETTTSRIRDNPPVVVEPRRIVVTGIGIVSPLAVGKQASWDNLLAGISAVDKIVCFDIEKYPLGISIAGQVPMETMRSRYRRQFKDEELFDAGRLLGIKKKEDEKLPNFIKFALVASDEAIRDAQISLQHKSIQNRAGVSIGVGMTSIDDIVEAQRHIDHSELGFRKISPYFVPKILPNIAAGHVAIRNQIQGPNLCSSTACAAGAHSIADAMRYIQYGAADVMLAGGTESCINPISIAGFSRAKALSKSYDENPSVASRPFDKNRDGFVIAEGSCILVLEEINHALQRNARIYAELRSVGASGDAYHITAPSPSGQGAIHAMKSALKFGGLLAEDINYVNAHATSTPMGDSIENMAIGALIVPRKNFVVSSTKGSTGHLLGAAGALEAGFTALAVKNDIAPPTLNLENTDKGFDFNYAANKPVELKINAALSNSFGFGGTNITLLFSKWLE